MTPGDLSIGKQWANRNDKTKARNSEAIIAEGVIKAWRTASRLYRAKKSPWHRGRLLNREKDNRSDLRVDARRGLEAKRSGVPQKGIIKRFSPNS